MSDKIRTSNVMFGDKRNKYNLGMWVSQTKSVQLSVANATEGSKAVKTRQAEAERVKEMKRKLQESSLTLGTASNNESTWRSTNARTPFTAQEQRDARGKLDPVVARRISQSKFVLYL